MYLKKFTISTFSIFTLLSFTAVMGVDSNHGAAGNLPPYEDPEVTSIHLEPYRATFTPYPSAELALQEKEGSPRIINLNGIWKFKMVNGKSQVPEGYMEEDFQDTLWEQIPVPGNWQRYGFGVPVYSNSKLNTEPDEVGLYRRRFELPEDWQDDRVFLHFAGVKTAFHVYVNGQEVGYNEGAFLPGEFDVTGYLKPGGNVLAVTVYRIAEVSQIENFDTWRLSGIFRGVELVRRPPCHIQDFEVRAPLVNDYRDGNWQVRASIRNQSAEPASQLRLSVALWDHQAGKRLHEKTVELESIGAGAAIGTDIEKLFPAIRPWSDEKPYLYTTILTLKDSNGTPLEAVAAKTGFRTVEVQGRRLLINGERLIFRGVNRHSWSADTARVPEPEMLRKELELMKRYNINAIRTSHYPADPTLYKLADELGLFIMDEAAQETHWKNDCASREGWLNPHLVRMQGMIERDKNHPSVVMWSSGNEYFRGANTDAMALYAARRDPSRPIYYEGEKPKSAGAFEPFERQIYNTGYKLAVPGRISDNAKEDLPVVMKEFMHARGNTMNRFYDLWSQLRDPERVNLSGGFIWDWKDQGWRLHPGDPDSPIDNGETIGRVYHAHDGSDGITDSNLSITPKLLEVSRTYQPIEFRQVEGRAGSFEVHNFYNFTPLSDFTVSYFVEQDGRVVHRGVLGNIEALPGTSTVIKPDLDALDLSRGEWWITFECVLKESAASIPPSHPLAWAQFPLVAHEPAPVLGPDPASAVRVAEDPTHFILQAGTVRYLISKDSGRIISWQISGRELLEDGQGFEPTIWRAPIAPDVASWGGNNKRYIIPWQEAGLDRGRLKTARVSVSGTGTAVDVDLSLQAGKRSIAEFKLRYTLLEDGSLVVASYFIPGDRVASLRFIPRLGIRCELTSSFKQVTWFGKGPHENYSNRCAGARIGLYTRDAEELYTEYLEPQANGNRSLTRWLTIKNSSGTGFHCTRIPARELDRLLPFLPEAEGAKDAFKGDWFDFTAIPFSEDELAAASLPSQLPEPRGVWVHLDAAHSGVSQKPFSPRWPEDEVSAERASFAFIIRPEIPE
ncbi:MAG TPA: glycoside hydrolase family 2 TIM barrel-domain containing protein [Tichowtungia sp.]|nr:glycoside hydrolase family 2 TIM barrel-domain containing protein [Tichowtungia sp.]